MKKQVLFFDMDGVLADFEKRLYELDPNMPSKDHPDRQAAVDILERQPLFYRSFEPIEGAIEAYKILFEKYDNYILSTASWDNVYCWTEKRQWVEEFLGDFAYKRLILSHNKGLSIGRALIDDRTKNGVEGFIGEHIHFGTAKFPNWDSVIKHLM